MQPSSGTCIACNVCLSTHPITHGLEQTHPAFAGAVTHPMHVCLCHISHPCPAPLSIHSAGAGHSHRRGAVHCPADIGGGAEGCWRGCLSAPQHHTTHMHPGRNEGCCHGCQKTPTPAWSLFMKHMHPGRAGRRPITACTFRTHGGPPNAACGGHGTALAAHGRRQPVFLQGRSNCMCTEGRGGWWR